MKSTKASESAGKTTSRSRRDPGERFKDEVYRQMFRLEAQRGGAELDLAVALVRGWLAFCSKPESSDWLKKISPICLRMIETAQQWNNADRSPIP
jgi:hypothetical protein